MSVNDVIMDAMIENNVGFVTTVPCKQLAGVIEKIEQSDAMIHVPSNREDEGMGPVSYTHLTLPTIYSV